MCSFTCCWREFVVIWWSSVAWAVLRLSKFRFTPCKSASNCVLVPIKSSSETPNTMDRDRGCEATQKMTFAFRWWWWGGWLLWWWGRWRLGWLGWWGRRKVGGGKGREENDSFVNFAFIFRHEQWKLSYICHLILNLMFSYLNSQVAASSKGLRGTCAWLANQHGLDPRALPLSSKVPSPTLPSPSGHGQRICSCYKGSYT